MSLSHVWYRIFQKGLYLCTFLMDWRLPELLSGPGAVRKLPARIRELGVSKVLIVTDKGLMKLNVLDGLFGALSEAGIAYVLYDNTQANPTTVNADEARALYVENGCEGVIAFGGGSPMDCAKIAAARVSNPRKPIGRMRGMLTIAKKLPPLFAVPTTAGTGSECTIAAVIVNPDTHEKYSIIDPKLRPKCAVLDGELTVGLPPHITAATGMDALTHLVEAYVGQSNTHNTRAWALAANGRIFRFLKRAYENGTDMEARQEMQLAAHEAGLAFTRAYVGYVHAIAHQLGGIYNTPHGLANAILLPYVLDFFGSSAERPLAELYRNAGLTSAEDDSDAAMASAYIAEIRRLKRELGIPEKLDMVQEKDIPLIVKRALREAHPLYPVPRFMDAASCEQTLRNAIA